MTEHPRDDATAPLPPDGRVVVAGAGLAALRTVQELRRQGLTGTVTVVGAEAHPPYDRPPLSKKLLSHPEPVWLADDVGADLAELADEVLLGHVATALDPAGPTLTVTAPDGSVRTLPADAVVVATGARAVHPPEWVGVHVLRTLEDAAALRAALGPGRRLVVVGAGWIGAEVAGVAAAAGTAVTVLEALPAPLAAQAGPDVGALTVPWYAAAGVELRTGAVVEAVADGAVETTDGAVPADVVLAAVGVRPETDWLSGTLPLTARGAVLVDEAGRVLDATGARVDAPGVRAVGDCADTLLAGGALLPGGHWDAALHHPAAVVADLLGHPLPVTPAPYVFSTQLGHEVTLVGQPSHSVGHPAAEEPDTRMVLRGDPASGDGWTALYVEETDGVPRLVAGFTVDRPRDVGALRKALAAGASPELDVDAAADPAVPLRRALR